MPPHPPRSPRTPRRNVANPYARPRTPRTPRTPNTATRVLSLTCPKSPKRKRVVALSPSPRRGVIDFKASALRSRRKSTGDLTPGMKKQRRSVATPAKPEGADESNPDSVFQASEDIAPTGPSTPKPVREPLTPMAASETSEAATPRHDRAAALASPQPRTRLTPAPGSARVLRSSRALALLSTLEEQVAQLKRQLLSSGAENVRLRAEVEGLSAQLTESQERTQELESDATRLRIDHDVLARRVLTLEAGYVCKCQGDVQGMKLDLARILASSAKERWSERRARKSGSGSDDADMEADEDE